MDMFNFACDIDMYSVWAKLMARGETLLTYDRKYHCGYAGRKNRLNYAHSHDEISARLGSMLMHQEELPPVLARAMGDCGYLIRAREAAEIETAVDFIQALS